MRSLMMMVLLFAAAGGLRAQDTGMSMVSAAMKTVGQATGMKGAERDAILEDGLRILMKVPESFPKDEPAVARAWLEIGRLQKRLARLDAALASLAKVLDHPGETRRCCDALHEMGGLHRRQKEREKAVMALTRVLTEFPKEKRSCADALVRIGGLKREMKDLEGAEAAFRQCLMDYGTLWRPSVDALDRLVGLYLRKKDEAGAREVHDKESKILVERFANGPEAEKVKRALSKMNSRARLDGKSAGDPQPEGKTEGGEPPR